MANNSLIGKVSVNGYTVELFREHKQEITGYSMFAEVKEIPGCFIAGDNENEILAEVPGVIDMILAACREVESCVAG